MPIYSEYTDQELLSFAKGGDERAISEIFERYWHKLLAVALNRLGNLEDAEECVQDVFVNLWKIRETLELKYTLYTYLSAAVRYRVLDKMNQQYRKIHFSDTDFSKLSTLSSENDAADANLLQLELMDKIESAVRLLPEKCQIVYRMSRESGFSHKKIAEALDISEKTVEAHLAKATKDIRKNITITAPAIVAWILTNDMPHKIL